ncbi:MAG: hypothetical protein OXR03_13200, partial [Rhodospirillaceae bacterium]|nr:hypothetical protein [Rhodospirillaceae bacterium]
LLAIGGASVVWGAYSLRRRTSPSVFRINRVLAVQLVIGFIGLEALTRIVSALDLKPFSNLTYLVNPACDDTYYRLIQSPENVAPGANYHPTLGWTSSRLHGHQSKLPWPPALDKRLKIWFFGDSFMEGVLKPEESVPAQFETIKTNRQSINFGVAGYGLDQIWLRYSEQSGEIPAGEPVVIGILPSDLDRIVFRYFFGFKPIFRQSDTGFELIPPPPREETQTAFAEAPAAVGSYAYAVVRSIAELVTTQFDRSESACRRSEKAAISAFLFDSIIDRANSRGHEVFWVLFVSRAAFYKSKNWRHDLIASQFQARNQTYLDTRSILRQAAQKSGTEPTAFYNAGDGHLNDLGNSVVARALAELIDATRSDDGTKSR